MKKWWILSIVALSWFTIGVLTACDNKSNSNSVPQIPASCVGGTCYGGYPYQYPVNSQIQFSARKVETGYGYYGYTQIGSLTLQSGYRALLKEAMGVCDRETSTGGLASCDAWINGTAEVSFQLDSSTSSGVRLMVKAAPNYNSYYNYYYQFPSMSNFLLGWVTGIYATNPQGYFDPLILNGTIWPANNSQGFEIRANGPTLSMASGQMLQLQVASGKVEDSQFSFNLFYKGVLAASGTMSNCTVNGYNYCQFL